MVTMNETNTSSNYWQQRRLHWELYCSKDTRRHVARLSPTLLVALLTTVFLLLPSKPVVASSSSETTTTTTNSPNGGRNSGSGSSKNTGILKIVENEIWDASTNEWKGQSFRWTTETGEGTQSPAEMNAPSGWKFQGDWKIVVNNINSNNSNINQSSSSSCSPGTDAMGWEYQFQYLRQPKRRRVWLRSMQARPRPAAPKTPATTITATTTTTTTTTRTRGILPPMNVVVQRVRDDWNFKGMGMTLYKSFIFPESCGVSLQLPLTVNFDVFDRNPGWPSVSSSVAFFFPWTVGAFLSGSLHVEWIKWVLRNILWSIPLGLVYLWYRILVPVALALARVILFPVRDRLPSPALHANIPGRFAILSQISKPNYNPELSERVGCSVSYRWSKQHGLEWRVSYWHSYLPTFLLYRQFLSQTQEQFENFVTATRSKRRSKGGSTSGGGKNSKSTKATSKSKSNTNIEGDDTSEATVSVPLSSPSFETTVDWWQKHFARLGLGTGYPIPSPPHFSCSAQLCLSGLYWGLNRKAATISSTAASTATNSSSSPVKAVLDNVEDVRADLVSSAKAAIADKMRQDGTKQPATASAAEAAAAVEQPMRSVGPSLKIVASGSASVKKGSNMK